ncbi:hypothetical protein ABMA28_004707 [Loxostege sticticalis]|uniref:Uncharacterized protein n=1 Tax=Loxostege sticticalis TaxID=481309 RepID=A0ABD0SS75_LOXSC
MAAYSIQSNKSCPSTASCGVHKHRPRPPPCPEPDKCYRKCKKSRKKCPSAMETVSRFGTSCSCLDIQAKASRFKNQITRKTHKKRMQKAYKTRSALSHWRKPKSRGGGGCVIL